MSPKRISNVSFLATGLFLVAGASLVAIGLRLVASERAVAEQAARARLRAQLREATGLLHTAAARLARAEPVAVVSTDGRFDLPPEPVLLTSLTLPRGRDTEADFYLRQAGRAETIDRDLDRAEGLYAAAAAEGRDETARLLALHRLAALARRREDPESAARHEADFLALLPEARASTLEALIVRSRADPPDERLIRDLLLHLGADDDAVFEGLLRDAGLDGEPAVADRRTELVTIDRLRPFLGAAAGRRDGAIAVGGRLTVWSTAADGTVRFAEGPVPDLPADVFLPGVTELMPSPDSVDEGAAVGEPFLGVRLAASLPGSVVEQEARRSAGLILAALVALVAAGAGALVLALRAARRESAAAREQAVFLTKVGHDLRTPLALIRMYAETIADGRVSDPEQAKEFAGVAAREAERLTGLVGDVLDLSRVGEGNGALTRRRLDLAELAREVAEAHRPLLEREGVRLDVAGAEPVIVAADPSAVRGALSNLLSNVARHAAAGGEVEIRVEARGDGADLVVRDRGPGFPEGLEERAFERFVRGPDPEARGAGLGLALVREVAAAHGGTTRASNRDGGGAEVSIALPLDTEEVA